MKTFKSIADVEQLRDHSLRATVGSLFLSIVVDCPEYRPENDGYLVLMEPDDVNRVLDDLDVPYRLSEVPFEGVSMIDGCFLAVYLPDYFPGYDTYLWIDADAWVPAGHPLH
jgi:hypothetical protein